MYVIISVFKDCEWLFLESLKYSIWYCDDLVIEGAKVYKLKRSLTHQRLAPSLRKHGFFETLLSDFMPEEHIYHI